VYAGDALSFTGNKVGEAKAVVEAKIAPSPTPWPTETATPTPVPTATPRPVVTVKVEALNMRSGPGVSYKPVGKVHEGDRLTVLGHKRNSQGKEWIKIQTTDGVEGWVAGWYTDKIKEKNRGD